MIDRGQAEAKVAGPAIGLLVTAVLGILAQLGLGALNLMGAGLGAVEGSEEGIALLFQGVLGLVMNGFTILMGIVILVGALKMKSLSSSGFAMAAAVIAMIPCLSPCCPLGLIFGIWALVAMSDPDVKAAFAQGPQPY